MRGNRRELLTATGAAAMLLLSQTAHATNVVATIIGAYDTTCGVCALENGTTLTTYQGNGGAGDTPSLFILNPTSSSFISPSLTLTGYQDAAGNIADNGSTYLPGATTPSIQVLSLPNITPHTVYELTWTNGPTTNVGTATGINLYTYDYDDELGQLLPYGSGTGTAGGGTTDAAGNYCGQGTGTASGYCAYVGNFDVKFSATYNGGPIAANFSPDPNQGGGNVAGSFVGWEGLDVDGLSETYADAHSLSFPGTLAVITTGTKGVQSTPEPTTLALLGAGLGALGVARRRRRSS